MLDDEFGFDDDVVFDDIVAFVDDVEFDVELAFNGDVADVLFSVESVEVGPVEVLVLSELLLTVVVEMVDVCETKLVPDCADDDVSEVPVLVELSLTVGVVVIVCIHCKHATVNTHIFMVVSIFSVVYGV